MERLVTPMEVAPPLSPSKNGTHGGDRGSSVCRGGFPKHGPWSASAVESKTSVALSRTAAILCVRLMRGSFEV